mgnify:CR=1 FL=1|jgi:hypothetical protein
MTRTNLSPEEWKAHMKQWSKQMEEWVMAGRPRPWHMAYYETTYWTCDSWVVNE